LRDVADIQHGYAFDGQYFRDEPPGDVLLTPGNFMAGGGYQEGRAKYYVGPIPDEFVLAPEDLLVTMTDLSRDSETLGYPALIPKDPTRRFLHNQRLGKIVLRPGVDIEKGFLYYLLCTKQYRAEVLAGATGTTVKHTSPSRLGEFVFRLPPLSEQRRIARTLGAFDDKIQLNRLMSQTFESMTRALFRSWFVDFDPVYAKAVGRDSDLPDAMKGLFPDSLVDSTMGPIPAGWRVGDLGEVAVERRRPARPAEIDPSTPYVGLEHMPRGSIALSGWGKAGDVSSGKLVFRTGEILFGKLRPYFHKVAVAPLAGVCSTDIVVVSPRRDRWAGFVLGHVSSDSFVEYTSARSTGTRMPRTAWREMASYQLVLPDERVALAFSLQVAPMTSRIVGLTHEGGVLTDLRSRLQDKLLAGATRAPSTLKSAELED
jgi:type I restriction enzyme S subunit